MPVNPYKDMHFEGKQDDEVILYVIHPHWLMIFSRVLKAMLRSIFLAAAWWASNFLVPASLENFEVRIYLLILICFLADIAWQSKFYHSYRGYITDRRIVVTKSLFPVTIKRMTLFWKDAVKARDIASNFVWRMMKIGTLEISAKLFQGYDLQQAKDNPLGSEIQMRYVKYFVEITNYIDNLIHLTAHNPEKINHLKPLVFSPQTESDYTENLAHDSKQK